MIHTDVPILMLKWIKTKAKLLQLMIIIENVPVCVEYTVTVTIVDPANVSCMLNSVLRPAGLAACHTFHEVYINGEGLCNRMWGSAYHYSTTRENCGVHTIFVKDCINMCVIHPYTLYIGSCAGHVQSFQTIDNLIT